MHNERANPSHSRHDHNNIEKKEHLGGVEHNCIFFHNAQKQPFSQKEFKNISSYEGKRSFQNIKYDFKF